MFAHVFTFTGWRSLYLNICQLLSDVLSFQPEEFLLGFLVGHF